MKIVLQEVLKASVTINGDIYSKIGNGLLLLVSFTDGDNEDICKKMALKISKLRIFLDENGKTNLSINDVNGEILSVSQFTLYANLKNGNRPSYTECMRPEQATELYDLFNNELKTLGFNVKTGIFGADMKVELINDGPYTLVIDSKDLGF
ncbi:MAG: D-tyrosyl-tRNA(Tyr) deacylase [Bacilli bacterium]|nr:D-tyrosyl-tRNA(Tyr) deacylase [Bacilli bacterium]